MDALETCEPTVPDVWEPVDEVPGAVDELLGVWHWGNTPKLFTWDGATWSGCGTPSPVSRRRPSGPSVGAQRDSSGSAATTTANRSTWPVGTTARISHLVCSTFVYTRVPYDPSAPIPGGPPPPG